MKKCAFFLILILILSLSPATAGEVRPIPDTIEVTGNIAHKNHIKSVVELFLSRSGYDTSSLDKVNFTNLEPGRSVTLDIPLKSADTGDESVKNITFKNISMPEIPPRLLALSNHPERIKDRGLLFEAGIVKYKPVRLRYYHHVDEKDKPCLVSVYLYNPTRKEAKVHIIDSAEGPSRDFLYTGHMSNMRFFHRFQTRQGWIENIPPGANLIRQLPIGKNEVISGTMDLLLYQGGPLQILVFASYEKNEPITYPMQSDEKDRHARGAYPLAVIKTSLIYSTDENEEFYTISDIPLSDIFGGRSNRGNYGVTFEYDVTLKNPGPKARAVNISFQPRGGVATGTFLIDGRIKSVGTTKAYQKVSMGRVVLKGRSEKRFKILTMPEDASNYPVRLIFSTE